MIFSRREFPEPVMMMLAIGTTFRLLLATVKVRSLAGVASSLIVIATPSVLAGSVGSLVTPLTAKELSGEAVMPPSIRSLVVATSIPIVGAPGTTTIQGL